MLLPTALDNEKSSDEEFVCTLHFINTSSFGMNSHTNYQALVAVKMSNVFCCLSTKENKLKSERLSVWWLLFLCFSFSDVPEAPPGSSDIILQS